MNLSDSELIIAFQKGDYSVFEKLYDRYFDKVYRYLFYKTNGNKILTQDLCSETFLSVFDHLDAFKVEENNYFGAWVLRIAYHKLVDYLRMTPDDLLPFDEDHLLDKQENLIHALQLKAEADLILNFLDTLGEEKKDIILMRFRENMTYQEISIVLNKSEDACRQLFSRTLKILCEKFCK